MKGTAGGTHLCCVWCSSNPNMSGRRGSAFQWQTRSKAKRRVRGWEEQFLQIVRPWLWFHNNYQINHDLDIPKMQKVTSQHLMDSLLLLLAFSDEFSWCVLGWLWILGLQCASLSCLSLVGLDRILLSYCSLNEVNIIHLVSSLMGKSLDLRFTGEKFSGDLMRDWKYNLENKYWRQTTVLSSLLGINK